MEDLWYKGFKGSIEYSEEDRCFFGKVLDIDDWIIYEGQDIEELMSVFKESIDSYVSRH
jgi:predicted HicB family RNase H-like nuclease